VTRGESDASTLGTHTKLRRTRGVLPPPIDWVLHWCCIGAVHDGATI
jgi:hypothetical protein